MRRHAIVVEAKHTPRVSYAVAGFHEAVLYRWEYAQELTLSPKSVLVTSGPLVVGAPRRDDDVIAAAWDAWPPQLMIDSIVTSACGLEGGN